MNSKAIWSFGLLAFGLLCFCCVYLHGPELLAAENDTTLPIPLASSTFDAKLLAGKVVLTGTFPDSSAKSQVLARAREIYGEGKIVDNLKINAQTAFPSSRWLPTVLAALPLVARVNNEGGVYLEGKTMTVRGMMDSAELKTKLLTDATSVAGALRLEDKLIVKGKVNSAH